MLAMMSPRPLAFGFHHGLFPFDIDSTDPLDLDLPFHGERMMRGRAHVPFCGLSAPRVPKVEDKDDAYVVRVEAPGIKKEDLKVELVGRKSLVVSASNAPPSSPTPPSTPANDGQHSDSPQDQPSQPPVPQHAYTLWKRVDLPRDADWSKVQLSYADGLLTVQVGKKKEGSEGATETEYGEKAGALAAEVKEKLALVEALRAELEEETRAALQAQRALQEAKAEFARQVAEERRPLAIHP